MKETLKLTLLVLNGVFSSFVCAKASIRSFEPQLGGNDNEDRDNWFSYPYPVLLLHMVTFVAVNWLETCERHQVNIYGKKLIYFYLLTIQDFFCRVNIIFTGNFY